jgi:hypothetical protein
LNFFYSLLFSQQQDYPRFAKQGGFITGIVRVSDQKSLDGVIGNNQLGGALFMGVVSHSAIYRPRPQEFQMQFYSMG